MPENIKNPALSDRSKLALEKLPAAEVLSVMEDFIQQTGDQNNAQNNNSAEQLDIARGDMLKKIESLSTPQLKDILKRQGIL